MENKNNQGWNLGIEQAMQEIEGRRGTTMVTSVSVMNRSHSLPAWFQYSLVGLLILLAIIEFARYRSPHALAQDRDFETGARVGLLMVAEDIERIRTMEGRVPERMESALGKVLGVQYKKLDDDSFELSVDTDFGRLVFDDFENTVRMKGS